METITIATVTNQAGQLLVELALEAHQMRRQGQSTQTHFTRLWRLYALISRLEDADFPPSCHEQQKLLVRLNQLAGKPLMCVRQEEYVCTDCTEEADEYLLTARQVYYINAKLATEKPTVWDYLDKLIDEMAALQTKGVALDFVYHEGVGEQYTVPSLPTFAPFTGAESGGWSRTPTLSSRYEARRQQSDTAWQGPLLIRGKDGEDGSDGLTPEKGVDYDDGRDGTSVTVIPGDEYDGQGNRIVRFSDGTIITVPKGKDGSSVHRLETGILSNRSTQVVLINQFNNVIGSFVVQAGQPGTPGASGVNNVRAAAASGAYVTVEIPMYDGTTKNVYITGIAIVERSDTGKFSQLTADVGATTQPATYNFDVNAKRNLNVDYIAGGTKTQATINHVLRTANRYAQVYFTAIHNATITSVQIVAQVTL